MENAGVNTLMNTSVKVEAFIDPLRVIGVEIFV